MSPKANEKRSPNRIVTGKHTGKADDKGDRRDAKGIKKGSFKASTKRDAGKSRTPKNGKGDHRNAKNDGLTREQREARALAAELESRLDNASSPWRDWDDERPQGKSRSKSQGISNAKPPKGAKARNIKPKKNERTDRKPAKGAQDKRDAQPKDARRVEKDRSDAKAAKVAKAPKTKSPCPVDVRCGGCQNVAVPYAKQLANKDRIVKNLLLDEGLLHQSVDLRPILGMENPRYYRNKVASPFARGKRLKDDTKGKTAGKNKGKRNRLDCEILTGMYAVGTHQLVPTEGCLIENQQANRVIKVVKNLMVHHGIQPYDEDTGTGFMRHAVIRVGHHSSEVLVTLVTNGRDFPGSKGFCRELISRCPYVTTVVQNVNTRQTNVILGTEEQVLYGPGFILDELCDLSFRISSQSFYQVNAMQTEVLYQTALGLAALDGSQTVIDAYCGTGTIGLVAAKNGAERVIGMDSVADAIRDARANAAHNGIENSLFLVRDAGEALREWTADGGLDPAHTVLMMDPPRAGSDETFLTAATALGPTRIVYISCNPVTQCRDVRYLVDHGYQLKVVQPVDMFPHTDHIETVALLSKSSAAIARP